MHTVPPTAKAVVITEGEFDAMAVYQATGFPAISLPNGAKSMPVQLLPQLERFERLYLWLDGDADGAAGTERLVKKLGVGRCRIVRPRWADKAKDANDALRLGLPLKQAILEARPSPHEQILTFEVCLPYA